MYVEKGRVRIPELTGGKWINSEEISIGELRGKVILVDFWDYTCVNCIRTLPYLKEWYRRYNGNGLVIIGVHAPEFFFSRTEENVKRGIEEFGIEYPVVMDNDYRIWRAFANRYWPAKYLADRNGYIRYVHFGEGSYIETELAIQLLLREINPDVELPDPMKPVRDTDIPGIYCYRVSPELYCGYTRGRLGNQEERKRDEVQYYRKPEITQDDVIYAEGKWLSTSEYMKPVLDNPADTAHLYLRYTSSEVNLVINPDGERGFKVYVMQDGKYLSPEDAGDDVRFDPDGRSHIVVSESKMYNLIKNREFGSHLLELSTNSNGFAAYAFTFVSCAV
ncbi:MAG TPA: redoxin domain-containing protein [Thermodesulfobacteriota bacterium]|jgi:thiol-disulfide isomerase/thioredoxin|nr:redoxin domain-containing protein [Thermodesulfobacteriota bacterium]